MFLTNKNSQNLAVRRTIWTSLTDSDTKASWTTVLSASRCTNKNLGQIHVYRPTTSRCDNQRPTVTVRHRGTPASRRQPVAGLVETSRCTQLVTTHISIITAVFSRPVHCRQVQVLWLLRFYPAVATITHYTVNYGLRIRSVLGRRLWNSLPRLLSDTSHNINSFGHSLKTGGTSTV